MQPIQLEPGMRVRCVDAERSANSLAQGETYTVERMVAGRRVKLCEGGNWYEYRFKPIVRVKAPTQRWGAMSCLAPHIFDQAGY